VWNQGNNGDGTLFYPGRVANVGGTTDIPVESIRLKEIRATLTDMEYGALLTSQGNSALPEHNLVCRPGPVYLHSRPKRLAQPTADFGGKHSLSCGEDYAPRAGQSHVPGDAEREES